MCLYFAEPWTREHDLDLVGGATAGAPFGGGVMIVEDADATSTEVELPELDDEADAMAGERAAVREAEQRLQRGAGSVSVSDCAGSGEQVGVEGRGSLCGHK
jgi:hypothetical protein